MASLVRSRFALSDPLRLTWQQRLAVAGCVLTEPRVARSLDAAARRALDAVAAPLLAGLTGNPAPDAELDAAIAEAAIAVSTVQTAAYGAGAHWWRAAPAADAFDRRRSGLFVPMMWGARWAAYWYFSASAWTKPAAPFRRAASAAVKLSELLEDWTGFWRSDPAREWATPSDFDRITRAYEVAEQRVGPLPVLILAVQPPPAQPGAPRNDNGTAPGGAA